MCFSLLVLPLDIRCFIIILFCCVLLEFAGWHTHVHTSEFNGEVPALFIQCIITVWHAIRDAQYGKVRCDIHITIFSWYWGFHVYGWHSPNKVAGICLIVVFLYYYREKERAIAQAGMPIIQPQKGAEQARFTGGGFNLKQQSAKAWDGYSYCLTNAVQQETIIWSLNAEYQELS